MHNRLFMVGAVVAVLMVPSLVLGAQSAPPPMPLGLWANVEEGMILRIAPCGDGFCGTAAGLMPNRPRPPKGAQCGARILSDFRWNARTGRWDGRMQPPDLNRGLNSSITSDGSTRLQLQARLLLMKKTLSFEPFRGTVDSTCTVS
jgi:uncharacterized protein (DUF2147 family)